MAKIFKGEQGSSEWLEHRAKSFNASELSAAMGISSYIKRSDLVKQKATGITPEVTDFQQKIFNKGHEYEAAARTYAEEIIGEEVYPCVLYDDIEGMRLSASFDGLTIDDEVMFEHKTLNADLERSLDKGVIPDEYKPQMEQGLMLAGAKKCLFMASLGTKESAKYAWYSSDQKIRSQLLATWKQFNDDVLAYSPESVPAAPIAKPTESLPLVFDMRVEGKIIACNIDVYKPAALSFIEQINTNLESDQSFADAEADAKYCRESAAKLKLAIEQALGQMGDINAAITAVRDIASAFDAKGLALEKLVKARKEEIKATIVANAVADMMDFIAKLSERIGLQITGQFANFANAIKNKRSIDSIKDAVNTELAKGKIEATEMANLMHSNAKLAEGNEFLFPDLAEVTKKPKEDFVNLLEIRVSKYAAEQEQKRKAAEQIAQKAINQVNTAQQVAPAPTTLPKMFIANPEQEQKPLTLDEINKRLKPIQLSVMGISMLGVNGIATESGMVYKQTDFALICNAICKHIETLRV